MDPFHERLARVGLAAGSRYGLALAGGYAVQAHGLVHRPSEDVDLFTASNRTAEYDTAVDTVITAYQDDGLTVRIERRTEVLTHLTVTGPQGEVSKVEVGIDWRANEPVWLEIGPVLHRDDAVANKMAAVYGRIKARDYVDVDSVICSGQYSREELLLLSEAADSGFERWRFATKLLGADELPAADFAVYGVSGRDLDDLRARFAEWRAEILADLS
jgi:hypothetical protein